jgi:hypothetical protein
MASVERSNEDELLTRYLREAAPLLAALGTGPHPESATLTAYCHDELDQEAAGHVRVHLFRCDECFELVHELEQILEREQEEAGIEEAVRPYSRVEDVRYQVAGVERKLKKVLTFVLAQLSPLPVLGPGESVPLAAAPAAGRGTWVAYAEGDTCIALTLTSSGDLVTTVETRGNPIRGATVALVETDSAGVETDRAVGVTDENGEVIWPPGEGFESLLSKTSPSRWRVKLGLPSAEKTTG